MFDDPNKEQFFQNHKLFFRYANSLLNSNNNEEKELCKKRLKRVACLQVLHAFEIASRSSKSIISKELTIKQTTEALDEILTYGDIAFYTLKKTLKGERDFKEKMKMIIVDFNDFFNFVVSLRDLIETNPKYVSKSGKTLSLSENVDFLKLIRDVLDLIEENRGIFEKAIKIKDAIGKFFNLERDLSAFLRKSQEKDNRTNVKEIYRQRKFLEEKVHNQRSN